MILSAICLLLLSLTVSADLIVKPSKFSFNNRELFSRVKAAKIQCKPDHHFTAKPISPGSEEFEIQAAQRLFLKQKGAPKTSSTVKIKLPNGKNIDEYVAFLFKQKLNHIINSYVGNALNEGVANDLLESQDAFALNQQPNLKEKFVCPNVIDLEKTLLSNFVISKGTITKQITTDKISNRLKNTLLYKILEHPKDITAYVYIPKSMDLDEFVLSACTFELSTETFSDQVWSHVLAALKHKDDPDTKEEFLGSLVNEMCELGIGHQLKQYEQSKIIQHMESTYASKQANVPKDISDNIGLDNCDKIYLHFGKLSYPSNLSNDCEIVSNMTVVLLSHLNSTGIYNNFLDLVLNLKKYKTDSIYHSIILDKSIVQNVEVSFQLLNEAVANQMNLIKIPLTFRDLEITEPPIDSIFTVRKNYETFEFSSDQFPRDSKCLIDGRFILDKYVEFVVKKITPDREREIVRQEFFKFLWATETVTEFGEQFAQLFKEEFEPLELIDIKKEKENKKKEEMREKEKEAQLKETAAKEKSDKSKAGIYYVLGIILLFLILGITLALNIKLNKERYRRRTRIIRIPLRPSVPANQP